MGKFIKGVDIAVICCGTAEVSKKEMSSGAASQVSAEVQNAGLAQHPKYRGEKSNFALFILNSQILFRLLYELNSLWFACTKFF